MFTLSVIIVINFFVDEIGHLNLPVFKTANSLIDINVNL